MKKTIIVMLSLVAFGATAFAADTIEFPASIGKVSFPHKKTQPRYLHRRIIEDSTHSSRGS